MEGGAVGHNFERDPARFSIIWFSGFRGEDLNVIFYQNMLHLHNRYKSAERKISIILKQQWTIKISSLIFSIFSLVAILIGSPDHRTQFWKGAIQGPFHQSLVQIGPVASEELIKM